MNLANKPFILGRRDLSVSSEEMKLLEMYVATFEIFDHLIATIVSEELKTEPAEATEDAIDMYYWRPKKVLTQPSELAELYTGLQFCGINSTCFPPLYEMLILSFRWAELNWIATRFLQMRPERTSFLFL